MKKIILDTDPGIGALGTDIDDGLAIIMALNSDKIKTLGITIVNGNVTAEQGTINALNLLEIMNRPEINVYPGAKNPIIQEMEEIRNTFSKILERSGWKKGAPISNSTINLKPQSKHAVDFIIEQANKYPKEITMVCIGPLTNLALAIRKEPSLPGLLKETVIMGGGWTQPLDCYTSVAEFNMYCDPEAAKIVFHSGMPLYMTGFETSKKSMLKREHLDIIRETNTPVSRLIVEAAEPWLKFMKAAFGIDYCYLPDPQAIALLINEDIFTLKDMYVDIETKGELTRGMTVADRNEALKECKFAPNVKVCTHIDNERFMDLLLSLLK